MTALSLGWEPFLFMLCTNGFKVLGKVNASHTGVWFYAPKAPKVLILRFTNNELGLTIDD